MSRAIWKGVIQLPGQEVPVKLYSAVQDQGVHFRLLRGSKLEPVKQRMVNPETGKPVAGDAVRKGFEVEPGTFVLLEDEELAALEPAPSRDIEVQRVVPLQAIPHPWFERAYYLGPDGEAADYFALAQALEKQEQAAVATWVMRKRDYAGAVLPHEGYLVLVTLRQAGEVVSASELPAPGGRKPDEREIRMAQQLVAALEADFDIAAFQDEYRNRVLELVEAKASGKSVALRKPRRRKASEDSLGKLLEASLRKTREQKVA